MRWVLSLAVAAAFLAALVLFVQSHGPSSQVTDSPGAVATENQEADTLVAQDQAPHTVRSSPGAAPPTALERALHAYVARLIAGGQIDGPLTRSSCTAVSRPDEQRPAFRCAVVAGSVTYPFLGVVDVRAHSVTYCKRDPPPVPSENIPVSRRCQD